MGGAVLWNAFIHCLESLVKSLFCSHCPGTRNPFSKLSYGACSLMVWFVVFPSTYPVVDFAWRWVVYNPRAFSS